MRISDWSSDVCSSDLSRRRKSRIFEDCPGRFHDLIPAILLEQVDRPLAREQWASFDHPGPCTARIADDLEHVSDALHWSTIHELFERKGVLTRAREQRDDLPAFLPVVESRAGNAAIVERTRSEIGR